MEKQLEVVPKRVIVELERWVCRQGHHHLSHALAVRCIEAQDRRDAKKRERMAVDQARLQGKPLPAEYVAAQVQKAVEQQNRRDAKRTALFAGFKSAYQRYLSGVEKIRAGELDKARQVLEASGSDLRCDRLLKLELDWAPVLQAFGFAGKLVGETPFGVSQGLEHTRPYWEYEVPPSYFQTNQQLHEAALDLLKVGITDLAVLDGMSPDEVLAVLKGQVANPELTLGRIVLWRELVHKGRPPDPIFTVTDLDQAAIASGLHMMLTRDGIHCVADLIGSSKLSEMNGRSIIRDSLLNLGYSLKKQKKL